VGWRVGKPGSRLRAMRTLLIALSLVALATTPAFAGDAGAAPGTPEATVQSSKSPADLDLVALDGTPLSAETLAGKVVLFVNVASRCGFTPQYEGLQALFEEKKAEGFVIVGVPCNQFGGQEPGKAEQIATFCSVNYGVTFPLLAKQKVNGPDRSALYELLIGDGSDVEWNFEKFVVGRDGRIRARFPSDVAPEAAELRAEIDAALAEG
jgi:glutathione peroxidase-family protein